MVVSNSDTISSRERNIADISGIIGEYYVVHVENVPFVQERKWLIILLESIKSSLIFMEIYSQVSLTCKAFFNVLHPSIMRMEYFSGAMLSRLDYSLLQNS